MPLVVNKNMAAIKAQNALSNSAKRIQYNFNKIAHKTHLKLSDNASGLGMSELAKFSGSARRRKGEGVRTMTGAMMLSAFSGGGIAGGR